VYKLAQRGGAIWNPGLRQFVFETKYLELHFNYTVRVPPENRMYDSIIVTFNSSPYPYPSAVNFEIRDAYVNKRTLLNGTVMYEIANAGRFNVLWDRLDRLPFRLIGVRYRYSGPRGSEIISPGFVSPTGSTLLKNLSYFVQVQYAFDTRIQGAASRVEP